jgi:hypothetical protein
VLIKEFNSYAPSGKTYEEVIASEEYSKIINENIAHLKKAGLINPPFLLFNGLMYPVSICFISNINNNRGIICFQLSKWNIHRSLK